MFVSEGQYKSQQAFELGKILYKYTPPIIKIGVLPEFIASCMLLKFNDSHFLATAAHVLKYNDCRQLRIPFNKAILPIQGPHVITSADTIENDKIDIAIFKLDQGAIDALLEEGFLFYDLGRINVDAEDITGDNYITFGHPITRNDVKLRAQKLRVEPFNYRTNVSDHERLYQSLGIHKETHQALYYRRRKIWDGFTNNMIIGPEPVGMSGCGVWCIPNFTTADVNSIGFFPTAMIIEYHHKRNAMIGTRICFVTELIRKNFDPEMMRSRRIGFNQKFLSPKQYPVQKVNEPGIKRSEKLSA